MNEKYKKSRRSVKYRNMPFEKNSNNRRRTNKLRYRFKLKTESSDKKSNIQNMKKESKNVKTINNYVYYGDNQEFDEDGPKLILNINEGDREPIIGKGKFEDPENKFVKSESEEEDMKQDIEIINNLPDKEKEIIIKKLKKKIKKKIKKKKRKSLFKEYLDMRKKLKKKDKKNDISIGVDA